MKGTARLEPRAIRYTLCTRVSVQPIGQIVSNLNKVLVQLSHRFADGELLICSLPSMEELADEGSPSVLEVDVPAELAARLATPAPDPILDNCSLVQFNWISFLVWTIQLEASQIRMVSPVVGAQMLRMLEQMRDTHQPLVCGIAHETYPVAAVELGQVDALAPAALKQHRAVDEQNLYSFVTATMVFSDKLFEMTLPSKANPHGKPVAMKVALMLPDEFSQGMHALWMEASRNVLQKFRLAGRGH